MSKPLEHEIVFITGATTGIGRASALLLASQGAKLILTGRSQQKLDALTALLPADARFITCLLDVRDKAAVAQCVRSLPAEYANITVLINNAGLARGLDTAHTASLNDWEEMVQTNINGVLYCTHAILPGMVERNRGHIVNLGSIAGTYPYFGGNTYGATKAFLAQFSLNLRADLLGKRIRVTNIEPGMVGETDFSITRFYGDHSRANQVYEAVQPLLPEDIAQSIVWCLQQPAHVNINRIELMPIMQAPGGPVVKRNA